MKALIGFGIAGVVLLAMPGCTTTRQAMAAPQPASSAIEDQDGHYVAIVEYVAKQRGTKVIWVNPPRKQKDAVASR